MNKLYVFLLTLILVSCTSQSLPKMEGTDNPVLDTSTLVPTETALPTPTPTSTITPTPLPTLVPLDDFQKGVIMTNYLGNFRDEELMQTLQTVVKPMGANWVSFSFGCFQENEKSVEVLCNGMDTRDLPTDAELVSLIKSAHANGLRVLLQPSVIEVLDGRGNFYIDFGNNDKLWDAWFLSYGKNLLHYAELAQQENVELLVIGTEAPHVSLRTRNWEELIRNVRDVYKGKLTYAAFSYETEKIQYWDKLDYIGWNAYQGMCVSKNQTMDQTKEKWKLLLARMQKLSEKWEKDIIITEIGLFPQKNALCEGWFGPPGPVILDVDYQANIFQAALESVMDKKWLHGIFWYGISPNAKYGGMGDLDFTPIGKPAEEILRKYYGGEPGKTIIKMPEGIADEKSSFWIYHNGKTDVAHFNLGGNEDSKPIYDLGYPDPERGTVIQIVQVPGFGGLGFWQEGLDPDNYDWLEFYIRTEVKVEPNIVVYVEDWKSDQNPVTFSARSFMKGDLMDGKWHLVRIPLSWLNPANEILHMTSFLNSWPGNEKGVVYYLDDIRFVKEAK
jgi:hypothetical protein